MRDRLASDGFFILALAFVALRLFAVKGARAVRLAEAAASQIP